MRVNQVSLPKMKRPNGYWFNLLNNFADSNAECIEVVPAHGEYKNIRSLQCTVAGAIYRYKFNMSTKMDSDRLYVIKRIRKDR